MSTHNICLYKEVDKKYTGCNLKTTEFLDFVLMGVCAVIRLNTVSPNMRKHTFRHVRPKRTQLKLISLLIQSEQSSLSAGRNFASLAAQNAPSEDSDQTVQMCRLI